MSNRELIINASGRDMYQVRTDTATYPRIADIPDAQGIEALDKLVWGACVIRGAEMTPKARNIVARALWDKLKGDFWGLAMPEVSDAIHRGCYEEYGEVFGITPASLYKMVAAYRRTNLQAVIRRQEEARKADVEATAKFLAQHSEYARQILNKFNK